LSEDIHSAFSKNAGAFDTTRQKGAMWAEGDAQLPYNATKVVHIVNHAVEGNSIYHYADATSRSGDEVASKKRAHAKPAYDQV
jgi:hypothetical protein